MSDIFRDVAKRAEHQLQSMLDLEKQVEKINLVVKAEEEAIHNVSLADLRAWAGYKRLACSWLTSGVIERMCQLPKRGTTYSPQGGHHKGIGRAI